MLRTILALGVSAVASMSIGVGSKFPQAALSKFGCSGKKSVIFFYGADDGTLADAERWLCQT
jgi:hypothetical protein